MEIFLQQKFIDYSNYILVTYYVVSRTNLLMAAKEIAIGQSVGNPSVRSVWETEELWSRHSCKIMADDASIPYLEKHKEGYITIAFPLDNIDLKEDGISQLLCQIMGGQLDIDDILMCHVIDIKLPPPLHEPKYGLNGARQYTGVFGKPLLGGIVKPKVGISPYTLLEIVKEMCDGGVNFIKEDEILSNPAHCPFEARTELIANYLNKYQPHVIYCTCINSDPPYLLQRARRVYELGGNGVHINFWSGFGSYKAVRELNLPLFIHFQKSGDKILTSRNNQFHIRWDVICKLVAWCGVDFAHAGMLGGYSGDSKSELLNSMEQLLYYNTTPALSCGMHPGLVDYITEQVGHVNYMANVGGAIHGHPQGTKAGAAAMRQAIDKNYGFEYEEAIRAWGKK